MHMGGKAQIQHSQSTIQTARASTQHAGRDLKLQTGQDIQINGANQQAARNIDLIASQDLLLRGTQAHAEGDIHLKAGNDLNILAAQNQSREQTNRHSGGGEVGVALGGEDGISLYASVDYGKGQLNRQAAKQQNADIRADGNLQLQSGQDTHIQGAYLEGQNVDVKTGRNLHIASTPDSGKVQGKELDVSVTVSIGYGGKVGVSGSAGFGKAIGKTDWIDQQTALIAKDRLNIHTENHSQIDAAIINSESGNLTLDTNTLGYSHHQGIEREHGWYLNAGGSYSFSAGTDNPAKAVPDKSQNDKSGNNSWNLSGHDYQKDRQQNVLATIGDGQIIVRNDLITGENSLIGINRDPNNTYQITRDYSRNTQLYLSSTSIEDISDPLATWERWKQNIHDYPENTLKTLENASDLIGEIGARAEKTWQAIQAQRVTLKDVPEVLRQHLSDEQALAIAKNLVRNGFSPEAINQLDPNSLQELTWLAKEIQQFDFERAQCEANGSCTNNNHKNASNPPVVSASGLITLDEIPVTLTTGETLLSGANAMKHHIDSLPTEQAQIMMIGAQALMGGPVKAITSVAGNWLLTHFFGENIQQAKENAAVKVATGITPPSVDELTQWNAESKNAYRLGETDTNGDERVQGAVFVLDIAALGGSSFFARVKKNNSANKHTANVENKPKITIREHYKHHDEMVKDVKKQLKNQGYEVSDRTVSFGSSCSAGRCMPDIAYRTPDGKFGIIEVKTGKADLSIRQSEIFPQIKDGNAIPRGEVAKQFGLIQGTPLKEQGYPNGIPIEVIRFPGAGK